LRDATGLGVGAAVSEALADGSGAKLSLGAAATGACKVGGAAA
jgi:hypothetical protein